MVYLTSIALYGGEDCSQLLYAGHCLGDELGNTVTLPGKVNNTLLQRCICVFQVWLQQTTLNVGHSSKNGVIFVNNDFKVSTLCA